MDTEIRKGNRKDLPGIYGLVKELAIYEKEPEAVTATLEEYERDFSEGWFEALVAVHEKQIVGMALFYQTYSTWKGRMLYLEDFVVKKAYRRRGLGQALFDAFLEEARSRKARLAKWQVLDWNEPALNFYRKQGAEIEAGWWNGKYFFSGQ